MIKFNMNRFPRIIPWITILILTVLFFLITGHEWGFSLKERFDASGEVFEEMIKEGNLQRRVGLAILGLYSLFLLIRYRGYQNILLHGVLGFLILFFVIWSFSSLLWSLDPVLSLRRLLVLAVFWIAAVSLSATFPARYLAYFAVVSAGIYLLAGIASELMMGTFQPFNSGYRFAGTLHPNVQGESCAMLLLAAVSLALSTTRYRGVLLSVALLALAALILSRSRTSFASMLLAIFIFFVVAFPLSFRKLMTLFALFFIAALAIFASLNFFNQDFSLITSGIQLGRDTYNLDTLNGRLKIWNLCLQFVRERPVIGHGYEGFWNLTHIYQLSSMVGWGLKSAHSAYIDLLLNVGLVGAVTYLSVLLLGLKESLRKYLRVQQPVWAFQFLVILFFLFQGLLESRLAQMGYGTFLIIWGLAGITLVKQRPE